jgi:hypothetical protein
MAEPGHVSGRIRREDADQIVVACLIHVAARVFDDSDRDLALELLGRALPLASRSSRMEALRPAAKAVLAAAPHRRKRGDGASDWMRAALLVNQAVARDALSRAVALVEV